MSETLEQIAERLAPPHSEVCRSHVSGVCDCWRERQRVAILDALREVEQRHHSTACAPAEGPLGGVECACFRSGLAAVRLRFSLEEGASTDKRPLSPKETETYERLRQTWAKRLDRISEAAEGSERLTAQDYAVRINARSGTDTGK